MDGLGLEQERLSLIHLCEILDLMSIIKKGFGTKRMVEMLRDFMATHLHGFLECYGADAGVPKNHYSTHLAEQWIENLMKWLDCWPHERKHRLSLRVTKHSQNTVSFEKGWVVYNMVCLRDHV